MLRINIFLNSNKIKISLKNKKLKKNKPYEVFHKFAPGFKKDFLLEFFLRLENWKQF